MCVCIALRPKWRIVHERHNAMGNDTVANQVAMPCAVTLIRGN